MASIDFPEYLKRAMENAGYPSGVDVERATNGEVDKGVVYRWLRGEGQRPSIEKLRPVAKLLGIPLPQMLVAAGLATAVELGLEADPTPPPPRASLEDEIMASPDYSPAMKEVMVKLLAVAREDDKRDQAAKRRS